MALDQTKLRLILASVLSLDPSRIVPKQGNWFNPQDVAVGKNQKPDTWCAFLIGRGIPINVPMLMSTDDEHTSMSSVQWFKGYIELNFIGTQSEEMAQSVPHWIHREDVKTAFRAIDAELMADDAVYKTDTYYQEGLNNTLVRRVSIKVLYSSWIKTDQVRWVVTDGGLFT